MKELYYFWIPPPQGLPEQMGFPVTIIPGLAPFVLLHIHNGTPPPQAIPALAVRDFLMEYKP